MREDILKFVDIEAVVDHDDAENSEYDTDDFGMPRRCSTLTSQQSPCRICDR